MNSEIKQTISVWYWNQPENGKNMEEYDTFFKEVIREYYRKGRIKRKMLLAI